MLTKSRLKKALGCPTKLYYSHHKYRDESQVDPFLAALAEGGMQVGELAKLHFPEGKEVVERNPGAAVTATLDLLEGQGDVVLFEPAFQVGKRLARIDVFKRTGLHVQVIEVKSKSYEETESMTTKNNKGVNSDWFSYVADVAFQRQLVEDWYRERGEQVTVTGHLMVVDKGRTATVHGLNTQFPIVKSGPNQVACIPEKSPQLGDPILTIVDVTDAIRALESEAGWVKVKERLGAQTFAEFVQQCEQDIVQYSAGGSARPTAIGKHCKTCEFSDGKRECWTRAFGWNARQFDEPKVWDIWEIRKTDQLLEQGTRFLTEVSRDDLGDGKNADRQWVQVEGTKTQTAQVDIEGLRDAMAELEPPFHFIDFETIQPAIPFFKGMRPYEGMCFQFSHHVMEADGSIAHRTQFLESGGAMNPTFAFVNALYEALHDQKGTIFRYANHENTYLNLAHRQLSKSSPFDADHTKRLLDFIEDITHVKDGRVGSRDMVDLQKLVVSHFWHPRMGGSNSIKVVLPAVMESSQLLRAKYASPTYGTAAMPSLNFREGKSWFVTDDSGNPTNPYHLLPSLDELIGIHAGDIERFFSDDELNNGGAAMVAWSYLQQPTMNPAERAGLEAALLRYCELDTLAMVFIWEHFQELIHTA
jgi:hypothetical protein